MVIAEKKKLKDLKKKSWTEAKKLEQLKKSSRKAKPPVCHFCKKEGHFVRDCPEMEKLRKLSANTSSGNVWAAPTRLTVEDSSKLSFRRTLLEGELKKRKNQKKGHISDTSSGRRGVTLMMQINPRGAFLT